MRLSVSTIGHTETSHSGRYVEGVPRCPRSSTISVDDKACCSIAQGVERKLLRKLPWNNIVVGGRETGRNRYLLHPEAPAATFDVMP